VSRILVVDDDAAVAFALERFLGAEGHSVAVRASAEEGLAAVRHERFDLVLLDLRLPGMSGQTALGELRKAHPALPVVVLTAHGSAETAMDALAAGAFDHLTKPVELAELRRVLTRALAPAPATVTRETTVQPALVGRSRGMQEVGKRIGILARSDASVLVRGESGTGKEHVARAIHERSARRVAPFVPVACAALPDSLLEAELFGAAKGAFTGARERTGKIEAARGGTLFLDEIGEVSLAGQVKLLRFLEERVVERLGEEARRPVDLRVIAATNADLEARVKDGRFREDLYYRLNVVTVELPPLRERREDVPLLVEHFLSRQGQTALAPEALERLVAFGWPGNVRELRNAVEHAVALAHGAAIGVEHLPESVRAARAEAPGDLRELDPVVARLVAGAAGRVGLHEDLVKALERAAVAKALELTGGNQVAAAKLLDMNRSTFRKRMDEHKLGGRSEAQ
jgi:DNA-binding NtrC family response regulator